MVKNINVLEAVLLTNEYGMSVEIINFGARIKSIKFPLNSKPTEMIVGHRSADEYLTDEFYLGAICGRVCNRIAGGKFSLDGREYQLSKNDNANSLHGGEHSFATRYWQIESQSQTCSKVTLSLISEDGDQGYPGTVRISVTYQLTADNKLSIKYLANTDLATPINLTNHTYFNLGEDNCESLSLQLMASAFLESDSDNLVTGKILAVAGTDYNFTEPAIIGERQRNSHDKSLQEKNGFDHCFVFDNTQFEKPKAVLTSLKNRVRMSLYTDQPAMQLYTGFYLAGQFKSYQGLALEAQNYTDAINIKHFPNSVLKPNEEYQREVVLAFDIID